MNTRILAIAAALAAWASLAAPAAAAGLTPQQIMNKVLEHDFWGLSGADVKAVAVLKDKKGKQRKLSFTAISRKHQPPLAKSLVRFRSPPDLAGAGFLQVQNKDRDDDRFLYLPELKRSRRVAASQRSSSFMGTDFNFADMDRRDLRSATYTSKGSVKLAKFDCYQMKVTPKRADSPYSWLELSIRKDNFVPLQMKMFDRSKVHLKTLSVFQIKRIGSRWFITKSRMVNHREQHQTTLHFSSIKPRDDIPDESFTRKRLER